MKSWTWILVLPSICLIVTACTSKISSSKNAPSESKLPSPSQKMIDDVLGNLKTIRILDWRMDKDGNLVGKWGGEIKGTKEESIIFESSEPIVWSQLPRALRIDEDANLKKQDYNICLGSESQVPTLELTQKNGQVSYWGVANVGVLRCKEWRCDASIKNPFSFAVWLARHGVTEPAIDAKRSVDYAIYEYEKEKNSFDQFMLNMPKSLRSFLGTINRLEATPSLEVMSETYGKIPEEKRLQLAKLALSNEFPRESEQIAVLLEWKGKFLIDWAGGYQSFPTDLLMEYEPSQVMSVVNSSRLTTAQWIGLCRYFSSYGLSQKFPSGYKTLDRKLQQRIIKEVRSTGRNDYDVDKFNNALKNWKS
ncbi:MAG: hypothetical protein KIT34_00195 [Cyanobacteria bacterium TGS_CYA1]|nr:hypothetical protein [Cyanobacteria bacterium TGS_CYA1]